MSLESHTATLALHGMSNIVGPDRFTGDLFFLAYAARITLITSRPAMSKLRPVVEDM